MVRSGEARKMAAAQLSYRAAKVRLQLGEQTRGMGVSALHVASLQHTSAWKGAGLGWWQ